MTRPLESVCQTSYKIPMRAGTLFLEFWTETWKDKKVFDDLMITIVNEFQRLCTCSVSCLALRGLLGEASWATGWLG